MRVSGADDPANAIVEIVCREPKEAVEVREVSRGVGIPAREVRRARAPEPHRVQTFPRDNSVDVSPGLPR